MKWGRHEQDTCVTAVAAATATSATAADAAHFAATRLADELYGGFDGSAAAKTVQQQRMEKPSEPTVPDTFPMEVRNRGMIGSRVLVSMQFSPDSTVFMFALVGFVPLSFFFLLKAPHVPGKTGAVNGFPARRARLGW